MENIRETYNPEIELLKEYLGQYQRAKQRERQLEQRLKNIVEDMKRPIGGVNYSPINKPKNEVGLGSAAFTFRKSEQETRIEEQREIAAKDLLKIMDVFDYLDKNSEERAALELHYIDGYKWERVADEMHVSRSVAFERQRAGLEKLLSFKRIRVILKKYKEERGA